MADEPFQTHHRVIFRRDFQWYEGRITLVNSDPNGEVLSYQVQEFDLACQVIPPDSSIVNGRHDIRPGKSYEIPCGHENIRLLPIQNNLYLPGMAQIFQDPHANLYMEFDECKDLPCSKSQLEEIVQVVSFRRKIVEGSVNNITANPLEILNSILPKERNLEHLQKLAQTDSSAMLQLADAYRFGLLGLPKTAFHNFYMCAATGMTCQPGYEWDFGYPMGNGEALTACAYELAQTLVAMCKMEEGTKVDYGILLSRLKTEWFLPEASRTIVSSAFCSLKIITNLLFHAIRRELTSPFSLAFMQAIVENEHWASFCHPNSTALHYLSVAKTILLRGEQTALGDATAYQMERFSPKATKIFLGLPVKMIHGLEKFIEYSTDIHVEYRQTPHPPHRMAVNVFICDSQTWDFFVLPDEFEFTPFSKDAMEYMWGCVVFSMHRGDGDLFTGQRYRPSVITFADMPNDRLFASYVMETIGKDGIGTKIKIVDTRTYKTVCGNKTVPLYKALETLRKRMPRTQKRNEPLNNALEDLRKGISAVQRTIGELSLRLKESSQISTELDSDPFYTFTTTPDKVLCSHIESLKREGDNYFQTNRIQAAKRCYTKAINDIRVNVNVNSEQILILLGTLCFDRATCFRKMAEGISPDSSKTALKIGLADCEKALKAKSCMKVLPSSIKTRIENLKNRFSADIHRLSVVEGLLTTSPTSPTSPKPSQTQKRRGKKMSKKEKQKKKRKQRRKQRNQRNQQDEQRDDSENTEQNGDHDDDHKLISITTGKELWESKITPFVTGRDDTCPCCFDRFSVELECAFCAVNPCGHACCLSCLSELKKKCQKGSATTAFNCPVCRVPLEDDILSDAVDRILSCSPCLHNRIASLPLMEIERKQVVKELCLRYDFRIPNVLSALDVMLTDGLQASLRSSSDLDPSQKKKIYETARKPVDELWMEAQRIRSRMDRVYDFESKSYQSMKRRLLELQNSLIPKATKTAADYIWEKMNSAGNMGVQDIDTGEIEIDFHALHVNEARDRFKERVLPILPAVESILLVVGRGNHSEGGIAKLKPALKKLVEDHSKTRYSRVEGNEGVIRVQWVH